MPIDLNGVKALTFDVGGTVFDWRGTVEAEVRKLAAERGADVDIRQFATDWRVGMFAELAKVRSRELPWMNADDLHRRVLDDVLETHSALSLTPAERDELTDVWHRLKAWEDAPAAIERLRSRYAVVVLTVLSWSIAVDCSKFNGISWDGILSCEFLGDYKPDAPAYQAGIRLLRLGDPSEAMMVAAHDGDLQAAMSVGMRSAFVHREGETSVLSAPVPNAREYDISARGFAELADKLLG